jgi:hypothetical protein
MPLLDHFHPPLSARRHWDSFHGAWAEAMALTLNQGRLPPHYFAEARIKFGRLVEIDVASFDERDDGTATDNGHGTIVWAPPQPTLRIPLTLTAPDLFEVQILNDSEGPRLVAAVELVSPANKDRPASRHAFAVKCASYLHDQISVVVIDVVTERHAGLHGDLLRLLGIAPPSPGAEELQLYAASYRTLPAAQVLMLDVWHEGLRVGGTLPQVPLWLAPDLCLPLDLEATYQAARVARRIA